MAPNASGLMTQYLYLLYAAFPDASRGGGNSLTICVAVIQPTIKNAAENVKKSRKSETLGVNFERIFEISESPAQFA